MRTHHTNMDAPDYVAVEDLQQSAYILTQLLYRAVTTQKPLPRGKE